jgi:hypothetical protein
VQPMGRNMFAPGIEHPAQEGFFETVSNSERSANYSQGHTDSSVISPARERPPVTANPSDLPQTTFSIVDLRAAFHPDLNTETLSPVGGAVDHSGVGTRADLKFRRDTVEGAAAAQVIHTTQEKSQDDFVSPANGLLVPVANPQREAFPASVSFPRESANRERSVHASASAPVVKVSIGRVEIHAEFPAAVAKASPQRSPSLALSLDEYARLRREGKR